jgi:methionine-gamma-lyase
MNSSTPKAFETTVVHAGEEPERHLGSLSTPIYQTALHVFPNAEDGHLIHEGHKPGYFYGRMGNPTQAALEQAMCQVEGGEAALALASGMAAISNTILSIVEPGDHIVAPASLYATTGALLDGLLPKLGVKVSYVDATHAANYQEAVTPKTKLFYLESPANPTMKMVDIEAVVSVARARSITTVMDNTFATPYNQRPLDLGVDVVVHSATKYLGGHGDLTAGVIVGKKDVVDRAHWQTNKVLGGVIAPWTAWLVMRGLRTLALRMERHNSNALKVARFLANHPKVREVHYPGLETHPQHALARRQMRGYGGMLSFDVGGVDEGRRLVDHVKLCALAVSLGDVSTLIQHSASMTHAIVPRERRLAVGITDGLLRLSVGIEDPDDLVADLRQALEHV